MCEKNIDKALQLNAVATKIIEMIRYLYDFFSGT